LTAKPADIRLDDLEFDPIEGEVPAAFDCEREEQNAYIHERAYLDQKAGTSVTYVVTLDKIMVAFVTITMDALPLANISPPKGCPKYPRLPAMKIAQLGVDKNYKGRDIGPTCIAYGLLKAKKLSAEVGCRFLTIDAVPERVDWYEENGFTRNEKQTNRSGSTIAMHLDIQSADIDAD
jgi:hypothetical protein